MPVLVDAYNVLHATGVLPPDLAGMDLVDLAHLIADSRYGRRRVILVCDGGPLASREPEPLSEGPDGLWVFYAGPGRDADGAIEAMVAASTAPRRVTVVSSDRRVRQAGRRRRCAVVTADEFLEHLAADADLAARRSRRPVQAYQLPLDRPSVAWWRDFFGLPSGAADPPAAPEGSVVGERPRPLPSPEPEEPPPPAFIPEPEGTARWWLRFFGLDPDRLPEELR